MYFNSCPVLIHEIGGFVLRTNRVLGFFEIVCLWRCIHAVVMLFVAVSISPEHGGGTAPLSDCFNNFSACIYVCNCLYCIVNIVVVILVYKL